MKLMKSAFRLGAGNVCDHACSFFPRSPSFFPFLLVFGAGGGIWGWGIRRDRHAFSISKRNLYLWPDGLALTRQQAQLVDGLRGVGEEARTLHTRFALFGSPDSQAIINRTARPGTAAYVDWAMASLCTLCCRRICFTSDNCELAVNPAATMRSLFSQCCSSAYRTTPFLSLRSNYHRVAFEDQGENSSSLHGPNETGPTPRIKKVNLFRVVVVVCSRAE